MNLEALTPVRPIELAVPSPLQLLDDARLARVGVQLRLKRDDLISPLVPGNKWRKLKYNLAEASAQGHDTLLTFGGAYSNHIRAVAAAGHHFGFQTIGVIRGEAHTPLNPSLQLATGFGMRLSYLDRTTYRHKTSEPVLTDLYRQFGDFYLVPEGGSNALAVQGCAEITAEIPDDVYDVICCPCGTGGTLAGIAASLPRGKTALGFASLKGAEFLSHDVTDLQRSASMITDNWSIELNYHFGGYAKRTNELKDFIEEFYQLHAIRLEAVYVAKMMFGIFDLIEARHFASGSKIVATITG